LTESVPQLNDSCLLVCMIGTVQGLENVEEIAAVDGVDAIHLGSNDLVANMGKPGKFDDPVLVAAQERLIAACRKHGKFAGCGGNRDVQRQVDLVRKGCLFLTTQSLPIGGGEMNRRHPRCASIMRSPRVHAAR
jgi:staphyloferrin B biosynthesis citrate synthase